MTYRRRVRWSITAGSNAKGNTIKGNMDTALSGKALYRTIKVNVRAGTNVSGEYVFVTDADGDSVYDSAVTQMNGANATAGQIHKHSCDHDTADQRTETGCISVVEAVR